MRFCTRMDRKSTGRTYPPRLGWMGCRQGRPLSLRETDRRGLNSEQIECGPIRGACYLVWRIGVIIMQKEKKTVQIPFGDSVAFYLESNLLDLEHARDMLSVCIMEMDDTNTYGSALFGALDYLDYVRKGLEQAIKDAPFVSIESREKKVS